MNIKTLSLTKEQIFLEKKELLEKIRLLTIEEKKIEKPLLVDVNFKLSKSDKIELDKKLKNTGTKQTDFFRLSVKNYLSNTIQKSDISSENQSDYLKKIEDQEKSLATYKKLFNGFIQNLVDQGASVDAAKNAIMNNNVIVGILS